MSQKTIDKRPFAISLAVAVPILAAVWWGAASVAKDRGQIQQNSKSIEELQAFDRRCSVQLQSSQLQAQALEKDVQHIRDTVDEIREHVIKWPQ